MKGQAFGGPWTEEKLGRLREYLNAYMAIFTENERASWFNTVYLDAFAGSGIRSDSVVTTDGSEMDLLAELAADPDATGLHDGSPRIALGVDKPFTKYIFIERNKVHAEQLQQLADESYSQLSVEVHRQDANGFIQHWCSETDWKKWRSVVFLDPYGMQVEWATIEAIGRTEAIDMWLLFPLGQGVNRLLTRAGPPDENWSRRLTTLFGTEAWKSAFYRESPQYDFLDDQPRFEKDADWNSISTFFTGRLSTCFAKVANPLALRNSRGVPIFLLCFAAGNPKGAPIAVRIANHLLQSWKSERQ